MYISWIRWVVMLGLGHYLMYRFLILMLLTVLLIHASGVVVLFRCIHSSKLFLWHPLGFLSKANLCLAFASALRMRVYQVCLLSKVIPRYFPLSVCCSSVSSNIILMGFDLVDKAKSVVKKIVLFIFIHQSCALLDRLFLGVDLAVVAYSAVLHRTKPSAYIAHFNGDWNLLIRS